MRGGGASHHITNSCSYLCETQVLDRNRRIDTLEQFIGTIIGETQCHKSKHFTYILYIEYGALNTHLI